MMLSFFHPSTLKMFAILVQDFSLSGLYNPLLYNIEVGVFRHLLDNFFFYFVRRKIRHGDDQW